MSRSCRAVCDLEEPSNMTLLLRTLTICAALGIADLAAAAEL
ncbi:hypothetical protein SJ05684_b58160 (plasmid) [Sinorhizobium sojae CCBAU 05684]|uniref:Uncharacterized protein n=1 Tax=Sinorhizobium sojae CCBAU 05684 TaxID=716928 RepID=A0A249PLJ2_9HYPH|nr:hypothetical protein SJ05684_b58160 [Sinorhizobium sojae CCBAU 05684]